MVVVIILNIYFNLDFSKKNLESWEVSALLDPQVFCCVPLGVLHNKKERNHDFSLALHRRLADGSLCP